MTTRADVIKILDKFFSRHKPLDIECEKPEISRLTNGVLKNLTYLDYLIEQTIEKDIKSISKIQYEILNNSAQYLNAGGYLVYSTCSIEPEENLEVTNKFLYNNPDFELCPFTLDEKNNGFVQILPSYLDMEGFFIAKFRKKK